MNIAIEFSVPGRPKGKARPRHDNKGHVYTPKETVEYEGLVAAKFWQAINKAGITMNDELKLAYIELEIDAVFPVAVTDSKATQMKKLSQELKPKIKPDVDNIAKIIMDGLNQFAYRDDEQVVRVSVTKEYGKIPGVDVRVIYKTGG